MPGVTGASPITPTHIAIEAFMNLLKQDVYAKQGLLCHMAMIGSNNRVACH
jgi:hypothetical protein